METATYNLLEEQEFKITHDQVRQGLVRELVADRVYDLLLCMAGLGRSPSGVKLLRRYGITAVSLEDGYNGLTYLGEQDKVFKELRKFKRISTIFTYEELKRIDGQYFGLRIHGNYEHHTQILNGLSIFH